MPATFDDDTLEALLRGDDMALPDDGFCAGVMRRVQADEAERHALTLDATSALTQLDRRAARARRQRRWHGIGVAVGSALALPLLAATPPSLNPAQTLALLAGLAACAWALGAHALQER
jgi:hypothetical protein